jgi:hypothetical protein
MTTPRRIDQAKTALGKAPGVDDTLWHHSAFCRIGLPYEPVKARIWQFRIGDAALRIEAGSIPDPVSGWGELPLPYGKNPRLVLIHLVTEALRLNRPKIDVGASMSGFAASLGLDPCGRNLRELRAQVGYLTTATIRLSMGDQTLINGKLVHEFDRWSPTKGGAWPEIVHLDRDFFASLSSQAVALDRRVVAAIRNSASALDCYGWMVWSLGQIGRSQSVMMDWSALWRQFGHGYKLLRQFRFEFRKDLAVVAELWIAGMVEITTDGVTIRHREKPAMKETLPFY